MSDSRTQRLLRDPDVSFGDKAHLLERLGDTKAAYACMVEGLEAEVLAAQRALEAYFAWPSGVGGAERVQGGVLARAETAAREELELWKGAGQVAMGAIVILLPGVPAARMRRADGGVIVKPGATGWVSWVGERRGPKALVRIGEDLVRGFYAPVGNLAVVDPWGAVQELLAEREALEVYCPVAGDEIRHLRTGRTGTVFWVARTGAARRRQLGFVPDDPQDSDPISTMGRTAGQRIVWAAAAEVEVRTGWDSVPAS